MTNGHDGRTYVVTGSASGIGRATASCLERAGGRVIRVDRAGGDVQVDLASSTGREVLGTAVRALSGGQVDGAVSCAGVWSPSPLSLAVNYFGAVATFDGVRPMLLASDAPRAIVVSSIIAIAEAWDDVVELALAGDEHATLARAKQRATASGDERSYRSAKVALQRWSRKAAVSDAWGGSGILMNVVAPGTIETAMNLDLWSSAPARSETLERFPTPLGRFGRAEEVASVIAFLVSAENSYMLGQVIYVDGGTEAILRHTRAT